MNLKRTLLIDWYRRFQRVSQPHLFLARRFIKESGTLLSIGQYPVCVDIGAGVAPHENEFRRHLNVQLYLAIDIAKSDRTTVVANAVKIPLKGNTADIVACFEVIQHIPKVREVFDEVFRILRPGGYFLMSFPFMYGECDMHDYHRWTLEGIEEELHACGFQIVTLTKRGGTMFAIACFLNWVLQHSIPGQRKSWRAERTLGGVLRVAFVQIITIPTLAFEWIALGIDRLLPSGGFYMGGLLLAKKNQDGEA